MKRRALLAAALAAALAPAVRAQAQGGPFRRGLLWRIVARRAEPSHVFGTLHAGDPRLGPFPTPVQRAFEASRTLMLEYVPSRYARERFAEAALYLDDRSLEQEIGEADFERTVAALRPAGLSREFIRSLKPWGALLNLRISRQPSGAEPAESRLHRRARARRMPVLQMESVEEQIFTFDEMSRAAQVALLKHALRHPEELDALAERTLQTYLLGDLQGLWDAQQAFAGRHPELRAHHAELVKRVVLDRSVVMAYRMQRELRRGRAFVALGALHLYGGHGVLALLEEDGYRAERVY